MSVFTDNLDLRELTGANAKNWQLLQPFMYDVGSEGSGNTITVPAGFITDGASVPRFLWALLPSWGSYSRAAVVHDFLCALLNKGTPHPLAPTRQRADAILYEAMVVCGTGVVIRWTIWAAVRAFAIAVNKP